MKTKAEIKQNISCEGIEFQMDNEGFLINPEQWNEFVASAIAKKVFKKEITPDMLEILYFVREYYKTEKSFPSLTFVAKSLKKSSRDVLFLFGSHANAWKMAGLPQPKEELSYLLGGL
jgi:dissimilatory sulfite reductase related protein